ncbi:Chromatin-associated protein [Klebsormidium nitens]|uniref:DNA (cytosine-5)-methyltransferase n=1 Tax=Klebsormidium nitens TaxID=105231 RepID=A0A1Y1I0M6_KLENI|nr:Chromatin-associated protein [Klebsormidium nitens]|eukprot:GAQ82337.1 Chromatin-associated protein [Klebsormidium nitens]
MGRQGKSSARPSAMDIDSSKAGDEVPSDFEGVSGVSVSEDVGGVEAVSPSRPARKQKQKEQKQKPKPKARNAKRKASPVSEIEEEKDSPYDELAETETEEDTQIVEGPSKASKKKVEAPEEEGLWIGKPIPKDQAKKFWPHRYGSNENLAKVNGEHLATAHYEQASVDGIVVSLGDAVAVQGPDVDYVAIIYELFESPKREKIFHARWFWRVADTVLRSVGAVKGGHIHDKMVLLSDWSNNDENDNPLGCIKSKLTVVYVPPTDVAAGVPIPECDYWYNSYWAQSYNSIQHTPGPVSGVNPLRPNKQANPDNMPRHKGHSPAASVAGPVDTFVPPPPTETVGKRTKAEKGKKAAGKEAVVASVKAEAPNEAGPSSDPGPSSRAGPSSDPGPSVQATPSEDDDPDTPSKVNVVGLEKRLSEPTPSKKVVSLTELSGGSTPSKSDAKVEGAKERPLRKARAEESAVPATPSTATTSVGRTRRASSRAIFKPSPQKGELGSAEKPVALDSEDEEAENAPPARKTGKAAEAAPGPSTKDAAPEAKIMATVTAKIGAAVQAAFEGATAVKKAITGPETTTVEVTATATVTATVPAPKKVEPAPASNQPEVEGKVRGAPTKGPTKTANLKDFLDGHNYPKAQEFLTVLDMYAGCGGMSTGLGHGLGKAGVTLHHKWAVDMMECASETYKLNHPETHVRNESAENFFMVCIEWLRLKKIYVDGETDYQLPEELVKIIRSTYVPNYRLSAEEAIAELEEDDAFESVFIEEEVLDDELAEELTKKKKRAKKPAAPKEKPAAAAKPPAAKKSKSTKADPMTGRGGEPPKSEALRLFTHVLPPDAKGKEKVDEETGPAEVTEGSPTKPIEVPDEGENETGTKRKRQEKAVKATAAGGRRSVRGKKEVDYAKEIPLEVDEERRPKKAKVPAKVASKGKKKLSEDDEELVDENVYEVEYVYGVRWHRDKEHNFRGLQYRIRWKNYTEEWDTWEPEELADGCPDLLKEFVQRGVEQQILPLPGSVGLICGGPPCQGASGFNRFRNKDEPLMDPRNKQVIVFMDIAQLLRPRYVLMENVVDILKFGDGILGRYAIRRLVNMGYQSRVGLLVAGSFGVPQFRMRTFVWGAAPGEVLPPYPLPTHMVEKVRNHVPMDWTHSMVAYDEDTHEGANLSPALVLGDALRDLPPIENNERRDIVPYTGTPDCEFQRQVRRPPPGKKMVEDFLVVNDHHSLIMNEDDLGRSSMIPKKKGANFRDLPGVETSDDKTVIRTARPLLPSGKPIVPDYAISFIKGKSFKPFGRLWWDETVATVVTRAEPHNQRVLHPDQDRVLSIRENARLQGFPDYYKLMGDHPKNKYTLVGNAVAMPVAEALGKAMALAIFKDWDGSQPLCKVTPWTQ